MFQIDLKSRKSIYEQIVDNFKSLIINKVLLPDAKMPSVRELSKTLTVNPNTIQKAYRELEYQGFLYTVSGLGSFVCKVDDKSMDEKRLSELKAQLKHNLDEMLFLGLPQEDLSLIVKELLENAPMFNKNSNISEED